MAFGAGCAPCGCLIIPVSSFKKMRYYQIGLISEEAENWTEKKATNATSNSFLLDEEICLK